MIKTFGLTHVAVAVRDVDRASTFYRKVFGAVVVYKQDGFVQLQTPGARDVLVFEKQPTRAGKSGGIAHFGFRLQNPEDIDAAARAVKKAGGTVKERLRDRDLVRVADAGGSPGSAGTPSTACGI